MEDKPLYNSRIISTFVEYLSKTRPDMDIEALLADAGISSYEVADEGHWLTQRQVDAFHDSLTKRINDPSIFREAGRYMVSSLSITAIRQFLVGFITPIHAYTMLEKIASYLDLGIIFKTNKIRLNKVEVIATTRAGVKDKPYQCENRKGCLEALAQLFINKLPSLEHPVCMHQGGDHCRYIISWDEPLYLKLRRLRNYSAVAAMLLVTLCWFNLSLLPFSILTLIIASIFVGTSYYADYVEKKDIYTKIAMQGSAANRLLDQITIGYNNVLMVQEIGQAVSSILDIDQLLKFVMDTLQKRLDFDRGMIMLANPEKTMLLYMSGFGYNPAQEELLKKTSFCLDRPESRGQFVTTFHEQRPLLIDNAQNLKEDLSRRSYEFVEAFDVRSFICVPIVYEGQSEGVMAVDNRRSNKPLGQSDVSLLMGIAPQIGIGLNNTRTLQRVRESEERFRALSENSPDIIYTLDINGCLAYINPAGEKILGYRRENVLGQPFLSIVRKEDEGTYLQLVNRIRTGKETIKNFKGILLTNDGREKVFDMSGAPNLDALGNMIGIVGMLKDFTEQLNLEKQLYQTSKMNAIGTLTGGISHDFNNIVQAISGYNQLLMMKKTPTDPDWKHLMGINNLTQRATELVKQLLIFSRKVESTMIPIDINVEINQYYNLMVNTLPKTITVYKELAPDLHIISGDKSQLGQVIMNLTVNAKDAMPKGGTITIRTENVTIDNPYYRGDAEIAPGEYVQLRISDTGCGMDEETLRRVFEPFFTTKEQGKGTGIGLAVVYGVVKHHHGYIFCDSEPDKGTTVDVYLPTSEPMVPAAAQETAEATKTEATTEREQYQETILLVDDEQHLLETGHELLALYGYDVLTASSGEEALTVIKAKRNGISLVILDLMMPVMSGEQCLAEILKLVPTMKVIVASGYIADVKAREIINQGAADFIQKPYYFKDLNIKIRKVLSSDYPSDKGRVPLQRIKGV